MTTVTNHDAEVRPGGRVIWRINTTEMLGTIAIVAVWLAVLFDGVFGADFVSAGASGLTRIPSAIFVAFFAFLATGSIAKRAFGRRSSPPPD